MAQTGRTGRRALVIGGSLGGLFAANLLHRDDWDVQVFERVAEELSGRGAGIVSHPELLQILSLAGVPTGEALGIEVLGRVALDAKGRVIGEMPLRQVFTSWGRLYGLLKDAFPEERYHRGKGLVGVEQEGAGFTARFAGGEHVACDLLVGADGIRSSVRACFLPEAKPMYAGYVAWRGLVDEHELSPETHRALFGRLGFSLPPGEQMLGYPVAGAGNSVAPGERRYNFVWYRPADEQSELPGLLTDVTGRVHDMSIPPNLIRHEVIAAMRRDAEEKLAPQFAEVVRRTAQPLLQPIYDLESGRLAFGRAAIVGDAAFVARPHVGMGVTKAAGDAAMLAKALREHADPVEALAAFEAKRLPLGEAIVAHARHLGAYMQAQIRSESERAMAERYRTTEAVMAETAVDWIYE